MTELEELKTEVAVLKNQVQNWMLQTSDYRKTLCQKLDQISQDIKFNSNRVMELPCKERESKSIEKDKLIDEKFKNRDKVSGVNWAITLAILVAIINEWIRKR